jgi:opacity protein-like surface antigen
MTGSFPETIRPTGGARYRFTRLNALEASYSYSLYHFAAQPTGQSALAGYNRADLVSFNYVRYLSAKARVQPFITAGLGTNRFSGPSKAPAVVGGWVNADNGWQFAWNYGAGADLAFERHFALRLELRDYITGQPRIIPGNSHNLVPSVGVVFRFK